MSRKVILFELNEVPERVLENFCKAHPRSALARVRNKATAYRSTTEDQGHLSPWITWPTLHRGVANERHGLAHLGQPLGEVDAAFPPIWKLLAARGANVGVCGSLHSYPMPADQRYAFYLPDTFAATPEAFPADLEAFQTFNLAMAGKSARNVDTGIDMKAARALLPQLPSLKFSLKTARMIANQLVQERVKKERKVRRRTMQAVLSFDPFMAKLAETKPDFCTFFTNHVASAMHRFWGASYPQDFEDLGYDGAWIKNFSAEIDWSMGIASELVGKLSAFVDKNPEYVLLIASSMGQAAAHGAPSDSELTITDVGKFMRRLGIPDGAWKRLPAMMPDYSLLIENEFREGFANTLAKLTLGREHRPIGLEARPDGFTHVTLSGMQNFDEKLDPIYMGNESFPLAEFGFSIVENDFRQGCTGYHIPEGILLAYDPKAEPKTGSRQVSTCDVAPTILHLLDVAKPAHMKGSPLFS